MRYWVSVISALRDSALSTTQDSVINAPMNSTLSTTQDSVVSSPRDSLSHSFTLIVSYLITTHSHPFILSLYSFTLLCSLIHSFSHSFILSFTLSLIHSHFHSHTHSFMLFLSLSWIPL